MANMEQINNEIDQELEHLHMCSNWTKRGLTSEEISQYHVDFCARESDQVVRNGPSRLDVAYGDTEKQRLQIFGLETVPKDAPWWVFIHGGYWHLMSAHAYMFPATTLVKAGAVYVSMGYDLAPTVSLKEIVHQVKKAMNQILKMAKERGSRGVYISGHSAGGHLSSMMLLSEWEPEEISLVKGVFILSGIFDMRPLLRTSVNHVLHLKEEEAWKLSPFKLVREPSWKPPTHLKVVVCLGEDESPVFHKDAKEMFQLLQDRGVKVSYLEIPNKDHFDLVEQLIDPDYLLTKKFISFMGLEAA